MSARGRCGARDNPFGWRMRSSLLTWRSEGDVQFKHRKQSRNSGRLDFPTHPPYSSSHAPSEFLSLQNSTLGEDGSDIKFY